MMMRMLKFKWKKKRGRWGSIKSQLTRRMIQSGEGKQVAKVLLDVNAIVATLI